MSIARPLIVTLCSVALLAAKCPTEHKQPLTISGGLCGQGTVKTASGSGPFHVVSEESHLYILSQRKDAVACSQFHHHAVAALDARFEFALDSTAPTTSTLKATVTASALDPDLPEYRSAFPVTSSGEGPSASDRAQIKVSVREQVQADEHPRLVFSAANLSTLDGDGTAQLTVEIAGQTSTITFTGNSHMDGDRLVLTGTGVVDGTPHGIPNGTFRNCIEKDMPLDLKLVFAPGEASCGGVRATDGGHGFIAREFPDDAACGPHGFDTVRDITASRCAGCHSTPSIYEGLAPLLTWHDFRVNTARSGDVPLYLDLLARIDPENTSSTHMPLAPAGPLTTEELTALRTWANEGGHERTCDASGNPRPDPGPLVPSWKTRADLSVCRDAIEAGRLVTDAGCGSVAYSDVAARVLGDSTHAGLCGACHNANGAPLQDFSTYESAQRTTSHPYYEGLGGFEMELMRLCDQSMPPGSATTLMDTPVTTMIQWVREGAPRTSCGGSSSSSSSSGGGGATVCDVQAGVFDLGCLGCHFAGGTPPELTAAGSLTSLVNVDSAYGMPRVTPGDPDHSALFLKIAGTSLGSQMPLGGPMLGMGDVELVRRWITEGASLQCASNGTADAGQ